MDMVHSEQWETWVVVVVVEQQENKKSGMLRPEIEPKRSVS